MAIVVLLFLASMCVIKRVRVPFLLLRSHRASLTLSRAGLCSARRRSGSRRSTRSAAGVASSNPGARESATTHGAARAHTATPGLPYPGSRSPLILSCFSPSLSLPDSDLVPPQSPAAAREGVPSPPALFGLIILFKLPAHPRVVAFALARVRVGRVLFSTPLF